MSSFFKRLLFIDPDYIMTFSLLLQHILYAHAAYFMNEYGSLDMWSTQGMEKSHYRAKGVYFKIPDMEEGRLAQIILLRCLIGFIDILLEGSYVWKKLRQAK